MGDAWQSSLLATASLPSSTPTPTPPPLPCPPPNFSTLPSLSPPVTVFTLSLSLSGTPILQGLQRPNKTRTYKYVTVFLSSWHKSKKKKKKRKKKERKKILLAQGSRVFIFLPAATCYPHRGSPKTSYGLGWSGVSTVSCGLGLSQ